MREFRDVAVWLPQRRGLALSCESATVVCAPTADDPDSYEIRLLGGTCEISTRTWLRRDYREVIESGLKPGFAPGGPRVVTFEQMGISLARDQFRAELRDAAGIVEFLSPQAGRASLMCDEFNGFRTERPVLLTLRFSPRETGIRMDQVELVTPSIPLAVARLAELAGVNVVSGEFTGRLSYREYDSSSSLTASGTCLALDLAECTAGLTPIPWRGRCPEIELQELRVDDDRPTRLRFRGILSDVSLGDILATWGLEGVSGTLALEVGVTDLSRSGIERFAASGVGKGISLESLTEAIGLGKMTGTLDITIADLTIEDNHLKSLDAELRVADVVDVPNWVEGRLLQEAISRILKMELPPILPERVEFTRFGVRLEVRDEILYVFGTHGEREETILTVRMFERDMPLINEPRRSFDLRPWLDRLRAEARERLQRRLTDGVGPAGP